MLNLFLFSKRSLRSNWIMACKNLQGKKVEIKAPFDQVDQNNSQIQTAGIKVRNIPIRNVFPNSEGY